MKSCQSYKSNFEYLSSREKFYKSTKSFYIGHKSIQSFIAKFSTYQFIEKNQHKKKNKRNVKSFKRISGIISLKPSSAFISTLKFLHTIHNEH